MKCEDVTLTHPTQNGCYKENTVLNMAYEMRDTPCTIPFYVVKGKKEYANEVTHVKRR